MADSSSDNVTYAFRNRTSPAWSQIYDSYILSFPLSTDDRVALLRRGLREDHLSAAGYCSKPVNTHPVAQTALGNCERQFDLDNVPGFWFNPKTNQRAQAAYFGTLIPVRDIGGNIASLIVRNADPRTAERNKYIAFSSGGKERGRPTRTTTHCPVVRGAPHEACGSAVRLVEGILKADVATALSATYSLGCHGIRLPEDLPAVLEQLQVSTVLISFDQEQTIDVKKARRDAIAAIKELGYEVGVETWPNPWNGKELKGIDDALLHAPDQIQVLVGDELEKWITEQNKDDPAYKWVYCIVTQTFINRHDGREYDKSQFMDELQLGKASEVQDLIATRVFPVVHSPTYIPGAGEFVQIGSHQNYNAWRPSGLVAAESDVTPFIGHLEYLIPEEFERRIFTQWLAHNVQFPGKKINWAAVIQSKQGAGKSYFGFVMEKLLGQHNVSTPSNVSLHREFTQWAKNTQLVVIEELMADGRRELMNRLKTIITQPLMEINEKYRKTYFVPNHFNLLAFTNHPDALLLEEDDRRYFIYGAKAAVRGSDYFAPLWEWTRQPENLSGILHYLMHVDLTGFDAEGHAPVTESKQEMIRNTRNQLEDWVLTRMTEEAWPFFNNAVFNVAHLQEACFKLIGQYSEYKWTKALMTIGARKWRNGNQVKMSDGTRRRLWILRRHEMYESATEEFLQKEYEKGALDMSRQPGGNPLDDTKPF